MINVYVLDSDGNWMSYRYTDKQEKEAREYCAEEVKWEDTVVVLCPKLGIEQLGDFVGLTHSFELKGTL